MPSKIDKRAKGVQMTEQQPKILQIIDIVHTPPTADIVQMPESTDTRHLADGSRHENVVSDMVSPIYWFFFYDSGKQIVDDVRHGAQGFPLIQM
jgi:hypothetical protein